MGRKIGKTGSHKQHNPPYSSRAVSVLCPTAVDEGIRKCTVSSAGPSPTVANQSSIYLAPIESGRKLPGN